MNQGSEKFVSRLQSQNLLRIIDMEWKDHLREMDNLREEVQNVTIEQKDPLLIYKLDAFEVFSKFLAHLDDHITSSLSKLKIGTGEPERVRASDKQSNKHKLQRQKLRTNKQAVNSSLQEGDVVLKIKTQEPATSNKRYGRNQKVLVRYTDGREKEAKYKNVERDLMENRCSIVE